LTALDPRIIVLSRDLYVLVSERAGFFMSLSRSNTRFRGRFTERHESLLAAGSWEMISIYERIQQLAELFSLN
jgi:hypothetical protein